MEVELTRNPNSADKQDSREQRRNNNEQISRA